MFDTFAGIPIDIPLFSHYLSLLNHIISIIYVYIYIYIIIQLLSKKQPNDYPTIIPLLSQYYTYQYHNIIPIRFI